MLYYYTSVCALFGLLIGSFLNVVIYRVPRGESIAVPPSHCPSCGHFLKPWELVPVFSYLFLKGRCRQCHARISWRYPGVELLTAALFLAAAWQNQGVLNLRLGLNLIFISILIALTFIDIDTLTLPDVLVWPLLGIALAAAFFVPGGASGWVSLVSAVGAGALFWLIALIYPQGMGLGDVKLVAALGAMLGFPLIILAVFLASFFGSLIGGSLLLLRKLKFRQHIPFGPFLAGGAVISLLWGERIIALYWSVIFPS